MNVVLLDTDVDTTTRLFLEHLKDKSNPYSGIHLLTGKTKKPNVHFESLISISSQYAYPLLTTIFVCVVGGALYRNYHSRSSMFSYGHLLSPFKDHREVEHLEMNYFIHFQ